MINPQGSGTAAWDRTTLPVAVAAQHDGTSPVMAAWSQGSHSKTPDPSRGTAVEGCGGCGGVGWPGSWTSYSSLVLVLSTRDWPGRGVAGLLHSAQVFVPAMQGKGGSGLRSRHKGKMGRRALLDRTQRGGDTKPPE